MSEIPFDRIEVQIKGIKGEKVLTIDHVWLLKDLDKMLLPEFVAYKVEEMKQALILEGERE
jgi:hypothetical protein